MSKTKNKINDFLKVIIIILFSFYAAVSHFRKLPCGGAYRNLFCFSPLWAA